MKNKEKLLRINRIYKLQNNDRVREISQNYRLQNKEKMKEYHSKNKENRKIYLVKNKDKIRIRLREYRIRKKKEKSIHYMPKIKENYTWKNQESTRKFLDSATALLHINQQSDWYRISVKQIEKIGGDYFYF